MWTALFGVIVEKMENSLLWVACFGEKKLTQNIHPYFSKKSHLRGTGDSLYVAVNEELVQAMQTFPGSLCMRAAGRCWIVGNDTFTACGTGIRQLMTTLLNLPILQSLLQVHCICIYTMGSLWLNFNHLQVRHPSRGQKQPSQVDWMTHALEIPSWIVVWCSPKPCWQYLLISLCFVPLFETLYLRKDTSAKSMQLSWVSLVSFIACILSTSVHSQLHITIRCR